MSIVIYLIIYDWFNYKIRELIGKIMVFWLEVEVVLIGWA